MDLVERLNFFFAKVLQQSSDNKKRRLRKSMIEENNKDIREKSLRSKIKTNKKLRTPWLLI